MFFVVSALSCPTVNGPRVYLVWDVHAKETNHLSELRLMLDGWIEHELVVSTQLKMLISPNGSFFSGRGENKT